MRLIISEEKPHFVYDGKCTSAKVAICTVPITFSKQQLAVALILPVQEPDFIPFQEGSVMTAWRTYLMLATRIHRANAYTVNTCAHLARRGALPSNTLLFDGLVLNQIGGRVFLNQFREQFQCRFPSQDDLLKILYACDTSNVRVDEKEIANEYCRLGRPYPELSERVAGILRRNRPLRSVRRLFDIWA